jgi:hypothetical protein
MGTDTPLAVLSNQSQLLYNYFHQLFAQVTNPPIDCIREEIVTSAITTIGSEKNLLTPSAESCHLIELKSPVLTNEELAKLKRPAEVYITHLKPSEIELTMQEIEELTTPVPPRLLQNNQVFDF